MKKSSLKSSWKPSLTCSPLGLSLPSCKKAKCLGVSGFSGLSAFPFVFTLGHHGPHHGHLARKKQQAFGYLAPVFCQAHLFLHLFLVEMNHGKQTSFWFAVCCAAKTRCSKVFFRADSKQNFDNPNWKLFNQKLEAARNIRKPSTQMLQCPKSGSMFWS